MGGGFSFENPNPLWIDDVSKAVAEVIAEKVNPVVATHGGMSILSGWTRARQSSHSVAAARDAAWSM